MLFGKRRLAMCEHKKCIYNLWPKFLQNMMLHVYSRLMSWTTNSTEKVELTKVSHSFHVKIHLPTRSHHSQDFTHVYKEAKRCGFSQKLSRRFQNQRDLKSTEWNGWFLRYPNMLYNSSLSLQIINPQRNWVFATNSDFLIPISL